MRRGIVMVINDVLETELLIVAIAFAYLFTCEGMFSIGRLVSYKVPLQSSKPTRVLSADR